MATFPGGVVSFPTLVDFVDSALASHQNERADEIEAIENYLLNLASGVDGFGLNYQISPSVSSNNLALGILGLDGNAPSSSNPVKIRVGNTLYTLTAATTFTKNAATNWMNLGSTDLIGGNSADLFVYAIAETGAGAGLKIGYSRISHANTMADFVNTSTDEKYIAGNWTNFNSTDKVQVIGRFRASLSVTSFNWSIPSALVINRPIYESDWLVYSPTPTGFSTVPATAVYKYKILYGAASVFVRQASDGTSNANTFTIPLPFTAKTISNMAWGSVGPCIDNGSTQATPAAVRVLSAAAAMNVFKDFTSTNNWTTSGGKRLAQMNPLVYEI